MNEIELVYKVARIIAKHTKQAQGINSIQLDGKYSAALHFIEEEKPVFWTEPKDVGPFSWLRWLMQDRLEYFNSIEAIIEELGTIEKGITVSFDSSWHWNNNKDPNDPTRCENLFGLRIEFNAAKNSKVVPSSQIKQVVCSKKDSRADMCLFSYQENKLKQKLFWSYKWTTNGFLCSVSTKEDIKKVKELFSDCKVTQLNEKKEKECWNLEVELPH